MKKNTKNYFLYIFALIFSVALYSAFVTLQYDPSMTEAKGTTKGAASLRAASVLLVAIVSIFLLYANNIFIKRRSKEIGLFQLIGMTKNEIFRLLSTENFILYFCSVSIGIFIGFSISKLILMVFFKVTGIEGIAELHFSTNALLQTLVVFIAIYLLIMLMNFGFIKRQSILALFQVVSKTEGKVKRISYIEMIIGVIGLVLIMAGYYISSRLFDGDFTSVEQLFGAMIFILSSVIIGTYLFYKGSVSFLSNIIRKKKNGYLNINEVLSLSTIMFRMKSNALLLTIITTVSALAIGLLSLSYISYYSAEKTVASNAPSDFSFTDMKEAEQFKTGLSENGIKYSEKVIDIISVGVNVDEILIGNMEIMDYDPNDLNISVISEQSVEDLELSNGDTLFAGYNDLLQKFMSLKDSGKIVFKGIHEEIPQNYLGLKKEFIIPSYLTGGALPVAIVDKKTFQRLKKDLDPEIQSSYSLHIGIDIQGEENIKKANDVFQDMNFNSSSINNSRLQSSIDQKEATGMIMFIVGFLGLTFLITSGCILYFKQMDESEDEKPNYTILRKLGFTQGDLLRGIQAKQCFNFGIPLVIGLLHSYFAIQSGWFIFGTELWTPMVIVMVLYTALYSIFGVLSVLYSKKVIKDAL